MTPRQAEVGKMVIQGMTDREIAGRLTVSRSTVRSHVEALKNATGESRRTALAVRLSQMIGG